METCTPFFTLMESHMNHYLLERAIAKYAGITPSQLKRLSNQSYFIDEQLTLKPLLNVCEHFDVEFNQLLVGTKVDVKHR